jgi:hypothetical protein
MERLAIVGSRHWPQGRERCVLDAARFAPKGTLVVTFDDRGVSRYVRDGAIEAGHVLAVLVAPWDARAFNARADRFKALAFLVGEGGRVILYQSAEVPDPQVDRLADFLKARGITAERRS